MAELQPPEPAEGGPSATAVALAVAVPAILILAALPFLQAEDGTGLPKLALFIGRFHPSLLHLPIALLLVALLLELFHLPRLRGLAPSFPATVLDAVVWLAALTGLATAIAGWLLAHEGGYDQALLGRHLWTGVLTGIGSFACVVLRALATARPELAVRRRLATGLLVATAAVMIVAAHAGGSLTHGEDFLTEYAPGPLRALAGLPVRRDRSEEPLQAIAEREAFDGVALRIFEKSCVDCHNPGKLKGGLRLDTHAGVLAGGQSGPVVVAGEPGSSELLKRIRLPPEDKEHMPPKGRAPLTDDEAAVLAWWVESGLKDRDRLGALRAPAEIRAAFSRTLPESERRAVAELQSRQASEYEAALAGLRASVPGSLRPILPGERELEYTAAVAGPAFGDAQLRALGAVGKDVRWLDLSRTGVTDAGLQALQQMPNLERLELRGTAVGDAGVRTLAGLENLTALGLYGTKVTDAGLEALQGLPALRRVYVGGTSVTDSGRNALRKTRKDVEVDP